MKSHWLSCEATLNAGVCCMHARGQYRRQRQAKLNTQSRGYAGRDPAGKASEGFTSWPSSGEEKEWRHRGAGMVL